MATGQEDLMREVGGWWFFFRVDIGAKKKIWKIGLKDFNPLPFGMTPPFQGRQN